MAALFRNAENKTSVLSNGGLQFDLIEHSIPRRFLQPCCTRTAHGQNIISGWIQMRFLAVVFGSLLLAACGGGGSEKVSFGQSTETINGIAVPPEPPADLNNATLAVVDVNANGVRDDIDRTVAQRFGSNPDRLADAQAFVRTESAVLLAGGASAIASYIIAIRCDRLNSVDTDPLTRLLVNSDARRQKYRANLAGITIGRKECP
jgi:hypothetical protein